MSAKLPYMAFYVDDYLSATTRLTCEEHGAYLLILIAMWKDGGSLPCDDVALSRIAHLQLPRWKKIRANIMPFFVNSGAVLTHKRVSREIEKARSISHERSVAGKMGADAKWLKQHDPPMANAITNGWQTDGKPHGKVDGKTMPSHISEPILSKAQQDCRAETREASEADKGRAALCVSLGQRITDLMGVTDDPRWLGNWSVVSVWLAQGYDPELDIWPSVAATVERKRRMKQSMPGSLKYFSNIIAENHKARLATGESPAQTEIKEFITVRKGSPQFRAWLSHFKSTGRRMAFYEKQESLTVPTEFPPTPSPDRSAA